MLTEIATRVLDGGRVDRAEALELYRHAPTHLLEPAVRRQAAAIASAHPKAGRDRLRGLLESANVKVRVAAAARPGGVQIENLSGS